jgi:hypothetical protein
MHLIKLYCIGNEKYEASLQSALQIKLVLRKANICLWENLWHRSSETQYLIMKLQIVDQFDKYIKSQVYWNL